MHKAISQIATYALLFIFWCVHFFPLSWIRGIGYLLGNLAYLLAHSRRNVGLTNLQLCFPQHDLAWRKAILRRHFIRFIQSVLERSLMRWAAPERIMRMLKFHGHVTWQAGEPIILLGLHTVGFEFGMVGVALQITTPVSIIYSKQKNQVLDQFLLAARQRFNQARGISRQEGIKPAIRAIRSGSPLCYLGDQDFGATDSCFVPFFSVPAATITALSRLAKISAAKVIPVTARMNRQGYDIYIGNVWENFPTDDVINDTRRMNQFIEDEVLQNIDEYFWLHKRFKTRPNGQKKFY